VFDGVGGDIGLAAFGLLGPGGRFCSFGMASGSFTPVTAELARNRGVTIPAGAAAGPEQLMDLSRAALAEAAAGRIRPVIGQEFGLADAARAHEAIEARTTIGKTLLTVTRAVQGPAGLALRRASPAGVL
jgi:NADPH2:quinone reductase